MGTQGKTTTIATKHSGVYKRVSKKRRNPKDGKPDEGFFITVRTTEGGKYVKSWLCVGWKSTDDMNADKANGYSPCGQEADEDWRKAKRYF